MSELADKLAKLKATAVEQLGKAGVTDIDHDALDAQVNRMKLIVDNKDAILVSTSDPKELETVRKNFVVKKLEVTDKEAGMAAVNAVAEKLKGIKFKSRIAFYYLVQKHLQK